MAEAKKVSNVTVNDGKGLLDNEGLIDSLIVDVNNVVKDLVSGQYISFTRTINYMIQKLANLKNNYKIEISSRDDEITLLRNQLQEIGDKLYGTPAEHDSGVTGQDGTDNDKIE
jgi:hypothetical protein